MLADITTFLFTRYADSPENEYKMYATLALGAVLLLAFVFAPRCKKQCQDKAFVKAFCRYRGAYLGLGIALIIFTWLRAEAVPLLSMQIWWLLLIVAVTVVLGSRTRQFLTLKKRIAQAERRRASRQ